MKVRATKLCFAGGSRRRTGAVFDFEPRVREGKTDPLPECLVKVPDDTPVTEPSALPPVLPGQAPRAGTPVADEEANTLSQAAGLTDVPENASFQDPDSDTPGVTAPPVDPDAQDFLK